MIRHATFTATDLQTAALAGAFDEDGFLEDQQRWTPRLAERIAWLEGEGELGPRHWKVIDLVRERYFGLGALPVMRIVCRAAGIDPGRGHELFSSCRSLWRIAGLPNPGAEALAYMN